jgi:hypothetical protein
MKQAFPDAQFTIKDMVGESDKLADRYTITGTHRQSFLGATGRKIQLTGITIVHISGGKIAARWAVTGQLGLLQQLGALPQGLPLTPRQQGAPLIRMPVASGACGNRAAPDRPDLPAAKFKTESTGITQIGGSARG